MIFMHQETIKKDSRHLLYFYSCSGGLEPTSWCLPGMPGWDISTSVWMTEPYTDAPACHWSSFHSSASVQFGSVEFSRLVVSDSL